MTFTCTAANPTSIVPGKYWESWQLEVSNIDELVYVQVRLTKKLHVQSWNYPTTPMLEKKDMDKWVSYSRIWMVPKFSIMWNKLNHSLVQHNRALTIWRCRWDRLRHALIIRVVSHCGLATCIKKYLKAKGRNSKISPCTNIIFKQSSKRNQNPSRYYNSIITNLKSQYKPKYHLSKILM